MPIFRKLFSIQLFHDYYQGQKTPDFRFVPSAGTQKLIMDHGLILRTDPHAVFLAAEAEDTGSDTYRLKRELPRGARFTFLMHLLNKDFFNFTRISDFTDSKNIYYFNNLEENVAGERLFLHHKKDVSNVVSDLNLYQLKSGMYNYTFTGSGTSKTVSLAAVDAGSSISKQGEARNGQYHIQFDLSKLPGGRCQLSVDYIPEEEFYALNQAFVSALFGVIEIFHSEEVPGSYELLDSMDKLQSPVYSLSFSKRSTYWRYMVINNSGASLNDPGIQANGYTFSKLPDGAYPANYTVFVSDQAIPLQETGVGGISLRKQFSTANRLVLDNLPNPGRKLVKTGETDNSKYYSDIFVYL